MPGLALIAATAVALALTTPGLRVLFARGWRRTNFRGRTVAFPAGLLVMVCAGLVLGGLALTRVVDGPDVLPAHAGVVAIYALGVGALVLLDDLRGSERVRGWRGHAHALAQGALSTGALKALGALALAELVVALEPAALGARDVAHGILAVAVLVLATNAFNLLDLRPGRSIKAFVVLGAVLAAATLDLAPLWAVGAFAGPVLVVGFYDVRERAMLGDTGANLIGGLAGLWLLLALGTPGRLVALAALLALTVYGELRSISTLVARVGALRALDGLGRAP